MDICLIDAVCHCLQIFVRNNVLRIVPVHVVHIVLAGISIDLQGFVAASKSVRESIHAQDTPYHNSGTGPHLGVVPKYLRIIAVHPLGNAPLLFGPFDSQFFISRFSRFADNFQTVHHVFTEDCEIASSVLLLQNRHRPLIIFPAYEPTRTVTRVVADIEWFESFQRFWSSMFRDRVNIAIAGCHKWIFRNASSQ